MSEAPETTLCPTSAVNIPVAMIWAQGPGRAIGKDGELPWDVPEDFAHFKAQTLGCPVVMGRATFASLGRPLPRRANFGVGSSPLHPDIPTFPSLREAVDAARESAAASGAPAVWLIGGVRVYTEGLDIADGVVITELNFDAIDADTFAPEIPQDWQLAHSYPAPPQWLMSSTGVGMRADVWVRPGSQWRPALAVEESLKGVEER